jgi:hypothetical protein
LNLSAEIVVLYHGFMYVEGIFLWPSLACGKTEYFVKVVEVTWFRWGDPTPGHVNLVYPVCDNKDHCGTARLSGLSDPTWHP